MLTKSGQIIPLKCFAEEARCVGSTPSASHEHCPSWDLASDTTETGNKSPNCTRPESLLPQTGANDVQPNQTGIQNIERLVILLSLSMDN